MPSDPAPLVNLAPGDVVRRGDHYGIVAACLADRLLVWPVRWRNAERAGEIPVTGWLDSALLGNPRQAMVQAGVLLDVPRRGQALLGRLTEGLLSQIARAATRNAEASSTIRRWSGDFQHRRDDCEPPKRAL